MNLTKTVRYSGYALLAVSILTYVIMDVLLIALIVALIAVIKQYRIDHPGTSIQDAMTALMTKPER